MLKISKDLFDLLYPVGTYYETSNANWTPSSAGWYGTWQEDTGGKTTVAKSTDIEFNSIGKTGGEKTHTLTISEMPKHTHEMRVVKDNETNSGGGLPKANNSQGNNNGWSNYEYDITNYAINNKGGGQSHNNLQPYIVVRRWHRTA